MLGVTTYQEALRALGRLVGQATELQLVEHVDPASVELVVVDGRRSMSASDLEQIVVTSLAHRGEGLPAGETADLLRSVGRALDELQASRVGLVLSAQQLNVTFCDPRGRSHELGYGGDELVALRRSAVARRNG